MHHGTKCLGAFFAFGEVLPMTIKRRQYCYKYNFKGSKNSLFRIFIALFPCPKIRAPPESPFKNFDKEKGYEKRFLQKNKDLYRKSEQIGHPRLCIYYRGKKLLFSFEKEGYAMSEPEVIVKQFKKLISIRKKPSYQSK